MFTLSTRLPTFPTHLTVSQHCQKVPLKSNTWHVFSLHLKQCSMPFSICLKYGKLLVSMKLKGIPKNTQNERNCKKELHKITLPVFTRYLLFHIICLMHFSQVWHFLSYRRDLLEIRLCIFKNNVSKENIKIWNLACLCAWFYHSEEGNMKNSYNNTRNLTLFAKIFLNKKIFLTIWTVHDVLIKKSEIKNIVIMLDLNMIFLATLSLMQY